MTNEMVGDFEISQKKIVTTAASHSVIELNLLNVIFLLQKALKYLSETSLITGTLNPFRAGTVSRRQDIKTVPALEESNIYNGHRPIT